MLDRIEFLIGEALVSLRRNTWMSFAAVTTSAMALFLLGGLAFVYFGLSSFVAGLGDRVEMKVFVKDSVGEAGAKSLGSDLRRIQGVSTVRFVPKDEGLKEFMKQNPNIDIKGLDIDNPLPNAYVVRVTDVKQFEPVASQIRSLPSVEPGGVQYPAVEQNFLVDSMRTIKWLGLTLGGLMLLTSGVLIYNAIRMTIVARRREIRIMQLVGATKPMIWAPMLLEGIVQGAVGGVLAALVLWSVYVFVGSTVVKNLSAFGHLEPFPVQQALFVLGAAGAAYGLFCSTIAMREPVRFRRRAA